MSPSRRFWFFLARTLGTTVIDIQRRMSAREFQEWQEYYKIEPWGDDWQQAGAIAAVTANVWSKKKFKPDDFIPKVKERKTPEQMEREMNQWARMYNARFEREEARKRGQQTSP